jgi:hypothetical protein
MNPSITATFADGSTCTVSELTEITEPITSIEWSIDKSSIVSESNDTVDESLETFDPFRSVCLTYDNKIKHSDSPIYYTNVTNVTNVKFYDQDPILALADHLLSLK